MEIESTNPVPFFLTFLNIVGVFVLYFIIFDIVGVLLISARYILWLSNDSMLFLAYPVWFIVAVSNAQFYTAKASGITKKSNYFVNNTCIIIVVAIVISVLFLLVFEYFNQLKTAGFDEYFVPGNLGLTLTYFVTLSLATILFSKSKTKNYGA